MDLQCGQFAILARGRVLIQTQQALAVGAVQERHQVFFFVHQVCALGLRLKLVQNLLAAQRHFPKLTQSRDLLMLGQTVNFDFSLLVELELKQVDQALLIFFERLTNAGFQVFVTTRLHLVGGEDPRRRLIITIHEDDSAIVCVLAAATCQLEFLKLERGLRQRRRLELLLQLDELDQFRRLLRIFRLVSGARVKFEDLRLRLLLPFAEVICLIIIACPHGAHDPVGAQLSQPFSLVDLFAEVLAEVFLLVVDDVRELLLVGVEVLTELFQVLLAVLRHIGRQLDLAHAEQWLDRLTVTELLIVVGAACLGVTFGVALGVVALGVRVVPTTGLFPRTTRLLLL